MASLLTMRCQQPGSIVAAPTTTPSETAMTTDNVIHWFEIPSADHERAIAFYEAVFQTTLRRERMGDIEMAIFPYGSGVGGAIAHGPQFQPSPRGVLPYLGVADVEAALQRAVSRGATVLMPGTVLPDNIGMIAVFSDSEGNSIGLHAEPQGATCGVVAAEAEAA